MLDKQKLAWYVDQLTGFFATYRFPMLFGGVLIYFLALNQGDLAFIYKILSIVLGAFAGLNLLVARHYMVNLEDKNPIMFLYPLPLYIIFILFLLKQGGVPAGISFSLFIVGISMFNVIDIFWRDIRN